DGIAELWFDDTDAMRALAGTTAYAAVQADEARFIERSTMGLIITEEHVVKDGAVPADGVKNVEFVTRKPGMEVDRFQQYWYRVHGPLAARIPVVRRYVQSHTRRAAYEAGRAPGYDGVAITWFDDTQVMRVSAATPEYARVRADEANLITPDPPFIITKEHPIITRARLRRLADSLIMDPVGTEPQDGGDPGQHSRGQILILITTI